MLEAGSQKVHIAFEEKITGENILGKKGDLAILFSLEERFSKCYHSQYRKQSNQ